MRPKTKQNAIHWRSLGPNILKERRNLSYPKPCPPPSSPLGGEPEDQRDALSGSGAGTLQATHCWSPFSSLTPGTTIPWPKHLFTVQVTEKGVGEAGREDGNNDLIH